MLAKEVLFWFTDPILTSVVPGCAISPQLRQHRKVEDAAHTNYFMTPETFHHIWIASSFAWYYFEACVALCRRVHILFSTFDPQWVMCATCELDALHTLSAQVIPRVYYCAPSTHIFHWTVFVGVRRRPTFATCWDSTELPRLGSGVGEELRTGLTHFLLFFCLYFFHRLTTNWNLAQAF